jgi:hypothetical protein
MEKKNDTISTVKITNPLTQKMDRKEALKKSGYIAAATMLILLNSNKAKGGVTS